jgi:hypothetical protein
LATPARRFAREREETNCMDTFVSSLVPIATIAVAFVLLLGLLNMLRGGSPNTSQRLMRMRVLLQFIAIIVIMGVVWWRAT